MTRCVPAGALRALAALLSLTLAGGCVSFSSSNPTPPASNTVVVPAR
jgi:hypothetical protein